MGCYLEAIEVTRIFPSHKPTRQPFSITILATSADLVASGYGIPTHVGPFDGGVGGHMRLSFGLGTLALPQRGVGDVILLT